MRAGQQVYVRDESWVVVDEEHFGQVTLLTLRGTDQGNRGATQQFLTPFDRVRPAPSRTRLSKARRLTVLSHAAGVIAASPRWRDCWTAGTAAIDLRPWQIEPVLGVIGGTTRMLLADDAGLGKTVQAALIISELMARSLAHRVLILSPASCGRNGRPSSGISSGLRPPCSTTPRSRPPPPRCQSVSTRGARRR